MDRRAGVRKAVAAGGRGEVKARKPGTNAYGLFALSPDRRDLDASILAQQYQPYIRDYRLWKGTSFEETSCLDFLREQKVVSTSHGKGSVHEYPLQTELSIRGEVGSGYDLRSFCQVRDCLTLTRK
jgi:hypothetical protein